MVRRVPLLLAVFVLSVESMRPRIAHGQTGYYNLDGSRPLRVEDAVPTERYGLDLQLGTLRVERYAGGNRRWRTDPKLSYGILPLTELEVRAPVVFVDPPRGASSTRTIGAAGIAIGALHAFNVETSTLPALAVGGELLVPVGALSGKRGSYSVKWLLTKTTRLGRVNFNAAYGTYSVRGAKAIVDSACQLINPFTGEPDCAPGGGGVPIDFPCRFAAAPDIPSAMTGADKEAESALLACGSSQMQQASTVARRPAFDPSREGGGHWVATLGFERPFGLASTLVSADIVAERFLGLYALTDWTAEVGVRHQLGPRVVFDAGVGRHFAGVVHSTFVSVGLTRDFAVRPFAHEHSGAPARTRTASAYAQTYLGAKYNWVFHRDFASTDRLFNAFDYGHAILYETLLTHRDQAPALLEGPRLTRISHGVLRHPPDVPLEEHAIAPVYTTLVPELEATFAWAHMLHRQLYDILADTRLTASERDDRVHEALRYYRSRGDLALSDAPKSMELMEGQPYSLVFRHIAPKFNGLLWSYHWLQMVLYDNLLDTSDVKARHAGVNASVAHFWVMIGGDSTTSPSVMPMSAAIAPLFSERYPDAAIIFDNLHALHDVVSDILASPDVPNGRKRATILAATGAYRDSTTAVTTRDEWRQMAQAMGVDHMGGVAPVVNPRVESP